jgi:hypothetical protein
MVNHGTMLFSLNLESLSILVCGDCNLKTFGGVERKSKFRGRFAVTSIWPGAVRRVMACVYLPTYNTSNSVANAVTPC